MPSYARRRRQMEEKGSIDNTDLDEWENGKRRDKKQKKLTEFMEDDISK